MKIQFSYFNLNNCETNSSKCIIENVINIATDEVEWSLKISFEGPE